MSSSHPLPTSTKPPPPSASSSSTPFTNAGAFVPTPALRVFITRLSESVRRALSRRRAWLELVDVSAFSRPMSFSDATVRIRKNLSYFRVNYLTVLAAVLALSLLSHPLSLFTLLGLVAAWFICYLFRPSDQPLVILNRTFSDGETLGILILLTICVIFLTSVGSVLMSSALIGFAIVCVHGAFRDPEDLFLDDQDLPGSGLFSFIGGASASAAAGPSMASPV